MVSKFVKMVSPKYLFLIICVVLTVFVAPGCGRGIELGPFSYDLPTFTVNLTTNDSDDSTTEEKVLETLEYEEPLDILPSQDEIQTYVSDVSPFLAQFIRITRIQLKSATANASTDLSALRKISIYYKPDDNSDNKELIAQASSSNGFNTVIELTPVGSFDLFEVLPENSNDSNEPVNIRVEAQVETDDLPSEDSITLTIDITLDVYARASLRH